MNLTRLGGLAAVLFVTVVLSGAAYFRVFFTEAGFKSVGRAWYYFRDYSAFGFSPTSLFGTLLSPFMSYPVQEPYLLAWKIQGLILLLAAALVLFAIIKYILPISAAWAIALISAISILPHMAYNLGNLDNILAILAIVTVLVIRRTWLVVLICIAAPLFHSMFVFALYPLFFFMVYHSRGVSWQLAVIGITMISMVGVILLAMAPSLSELEYDALMHARAPDIVRGGSFEYFADVQKPFSVTWRERMHAGFPLFWFALAIAHVAILVIFTLKREDNMVAVAQRVLVMSAPLVLILLITDIYRLTAWVAFNAMLYLIYLAKYQPNSGLSATLGSRNPSLLLAAVLPWMLLGPMGVTCFEDCGATGFPFFKRVIEAF